jgi:hypothetical protein
MFTAAVPPWRLSSLPCATTYAARLPEAVVPRIEERMQKPEGRSQAEGCRANRGHWSWNVCRHAIFWATFELEPLANTGGQDADFARLMDVNVRFSARPRFRDALLGTGGGWRHARNRNP